MTLLVYTPMYVSFSEASGSKDQSVLLFTRSEHMLHSI